MVIQENFRFLINGELVPGDEEPFPVTDPSTGEVFANCPQASSDQVEAAVQAAHQALSAWSATSIEERKKYFDKAFDTLQPYFQEIANLLHQEQGKPLANAEGEVSSAVQIFKDSQKASIDRKIVSETESHSLEIHRKPIGVVAGIVPWNYPVYIAVLKLSQAVVYGNTVVLKPSPFTPLTALRLGEILSSVFPPGVVNIIAGRDTRDERCVGDHLARHPLVAMTSFTGSIPTGKRVFRNSADKIARMVLELGGNDPAIVLGDVDVDQAAKGVLEAGLINSGQICCGIKRVYVHANIFDEFVDKISVLAKEKVAALGVTLGPINNRAQFDRVAGLVEDAVANGGKVLAGGKKVESRSGFFYEPTIVVNVAEGVRLVDEEQFGPVLPIMKFESEEEVIKRANNTQYGLGASVWGNDPEVVNRVATRLQAGIVWTNEHAADAPGLPFGGMKQSGIGRESDWAEFDLNTYTEPQGVKLMRARGTTAATGGA